jgi:pantetheine-phosphate adenylyltransferase
VPSIEKATRQCVRVLILSPGSRCIYQHATMVLRKPYMLQDSVTTKADVDELAVRLAEVIPLQHLRDVSLLNDVSHRWCERQRYWHGPQHLLAMIEEIMATEKGERREIFLLTALYHDAIYDPRATDNEEASAALLQQHAVNPEASVVVRALEIIIASRWSSFPLDTLGQRFFDMDTRQLASDCPLSERLSYERAIFREYQFASWDTYREKRREFLSGWSERFSQHRKGVAECLELLEALSPRIALYPGSFNPFHLGHLSTLRQAEASFDKVIVCVGVNRQKAGAVEMLAQRRDELQTRLRFHEVAAVPGLLTDYIDALEHPVIVVRGVRDGTDLEAELRYARFLNDLRPATHVVWISCEPQLQHLSSSAIRELDAIDTGAGERYVPGTQRIYNPE